MLLLLLLLLLLQMLQMLLLVSGTLMNKPRSACPPAVTHIALFSVVCHPHIRGQVRHDSDSDSDCGTSYATPI